MDEISITSRNLILRMQNNVESNELCGKLLLQQLLLIIVIAQHYQI